MELRISIPDDLALRIADSQAGLARRLLEALGVAEFKQGRLTAAELQQLLGFATPEALDAFLNARRQQGI